MVEPFLTMCSLRRPVSEVLISHVTNRGKVRVILHIGAGHMNNCQIILKLFGYDIIWNNLQPTKFQANLEVSEVLRGVLFIVRAGSDIIKTDFMHTKRTNFPTEMKTGIHLEELK